MIHTKMMDHQKFILNKVWKKPYFGIFAGYGLGKSLCALKYIDSHSLRKVLIVSTKTAIETTWAGETGEIRKHSDFRYVVLMGDKKRKINSLKMGLAQSNVTGPYHSTKFYPTVFLINFDGVKNIFDELRLAEFDMILVDESTKIKSHQALRTKVLWKLAESINIRAILTGFPVTENLGEIYSQIKFLDLGKTFGKSWYGFMHRYFNKVGFAYYPRRGSEKEILKKISDFCVVVTGDVIKLPPKIYKKIEIQQTPQQEKLISHLENYFRLEFGKVRIDTEYIFTLINKSLQICDGFLYGEGKKKGERVVEKLTTNKDEVLIETLYDIDIKRHKVLIWAAFNETVHKLKRMIEQEFNCNVLTLTGETENLSLVKDKFQTSNRYNVMIATQKKAAESITLTACNYAIYYSNVWSYDLRGNSEARIRRKGSEHHDSIVYIDFVTKDTREETVQKCLLEKKGIVDVLKEEFTKIGGYKVNGKKTKGN